VEERNPGKEGCSPSSQRGRGSSTGAARGKCDKGREEKGSIRWNNSTEQEESAAILTKIKISVGKTPSWKNGEGEK